MQNTIIAQVNLNHVIKTVKCTIRSNVKIRTNVLSIKYNSDKNSNKRNSLENVKSRGKKVGLGWRGGLFHNFRAVAAKT